MEEIDIKCMKLFFGYSKYYSVTSMLVQFGLPSFDTLIFNSRVSISSVSDYSECFYWAYLPSLFRVSFCILCFSSLVVSVVLVCVSACVCVCVCVCVCL